MHIDRAPYTHNRRQSVFAELTCLLTLESLSIGDLISDNDGDSNGRERCSLACSVFHHFFFFDRQRVRAEATRAHRERAPFEVINQLHSLVVHSPASLAHWLAGELTVYSHVIASTLFDTQAKLQ